MKKRIIDFNTIDDESQLHTILQKEFEFPNFYGRNINALIDCWSSLRYPEDEMTGLILKNDEQLIIEIKTPSKINFELLNYLISAIKHVNKREIDKERIPSIILVFL